MKVMPSTSNSSSTPPGQPESPSPRQLVHFGFGGLLARNTVWNILGQVIPLAVAVVITPYLIRKLGVDRFGVFSLSLVVLAYFTLLDLGLSPATTKFVAEALGKSETERIPAILWTTLAMQAGLGFAAGVALIAVAPVLVSSVLKVPTHLVRETTIVFYICSASILINLVTSSLRGFLEAHQRFDWVNLIRTSSSTLSFLVAALALYFGAGLPLIVLCLAIKNAGVVIVYFAFCLRLLPPGRLFSPKLEVARSLLSFGGWLTIIFLTSSAVTYLDRFLIGTRLSTTEVGYYTPPYDVVSRLWILPQSLYMTLFPAFSTLWATGKEELEVVFVRAHKYLILVVGAIAVLLYFFANKILEVWLGGQFAAHSTWVFQVLAIGFFWNCQAWIPSSFLQGIGRPDLVAILFLVELPLYVGGAWWLIGKMGIEGAALAWALRGGLEAILFFAAAWKVGSFRLLTFVQNGLHRGFATLGGLVLAVFVMERLFHGAWSIHALMTLGFIGLFAVTAYRYALNDTERRAIRALLLRVEREDKRLSNGDLPV